MWEVARLLRVDINSKCEGCQYWLNYLGGECIYLAVEDISRRTPRPIRDRFKIKIAPSIYNTLVCNEWKGRNVESI